MKTEPPYPIFKVYYLVFKDHKIIPLGPAGKDNHGKW